MTLKKWTRKQWWTGPRSCLPSMHATVRACPCNTFRWGNFFLHNLVGCYCQYYTMHSEVRRTSVNLHKFNLRELKFTVKVGMAFTIQSSWIQRTHKYKVSQCATYCVGFISQKHFCVDNSATCWSFLVCELQGPIFTTPINFISSVTVPNIKLDSHQSTTYWWIGKSFIRYPQEGNDNEYTKFNVNPPNRCCDKKNTSI